MALPGPNTDSATPGYAAALKQQLEQLVSEALRTLKAEGVLASDAEPQIQIERPKDKAHGDFASNVALTLAKTARRAPRELAQAIVERLPRGQVLERVEIAGPGFINFFIDPAAGLSVIAEILDQGEAFGRSRRGAGTRVQVEFVSANPTGPLHVGHGRGAAYGAVVAELLRACGYAVQREYYVNDAGRQADILALSVWLRYLERFGETVEFPANAYRGGYIRALAAELQRHEGAALWRSFAVVRENLADDDGDQERYIDALVAQARALLDSDYERVVEQVLTAMLEDIRDDLAEFGVVYDRWYSERELVHEGKVEAAIERLRACGHVYASEGAHWFRASAFGDEKDRVLIRENGHTTYFAADIAYHLDKLERGFAQLVDVWGADHHGYVPRVRAALQALGIDPARLEVLLVQFANLYRGGEKLRMSTRSGEFVTLRQLREEVGTDAARFFYVMRRGEQHLDFDLDLAKSQSADNPVYYIQYAHARVCSVLRQLDERGLSHDCAQGLAELRRLREDHELALVDTLGRYPEVIDTAAHAREPHQLANYLRALANDFHTYYNAHPFLVAEAELRNARLDLILATRQVIRNGLRLLGVCAPETM